MTFDYELKLQRAFKHLDDLNTEEKRWLNGGHHSTWQERDPKTGDVTFFATCTEPPAIDPVSLLIGDCLHNIRSALDLLAYALAGEFTNPLSQELAESSEFPIFGDESKKGKPRMGPTLFRNYGLTKIAGWDPRAETVVEGLQPYKRGSAYRTDPLWILQELDRVNKHRLLHTVIGQFAGTIWSPKDSINVKSIGPGAIQSLSGIVGTDTPIAMLPNVIAIDPTRDMHVDIKPALRIAFAKGTLCVEDEPVLQTLYDVYTYVGAEVVPALRGFLPHP